METRRLGRIGHQTSVLVYGAAALGSVSQQTADASIEQALAAGFNHFDTAANYGDAELRMAPGLRNVRDDVFIATKTQLRTREEAWAEINRSLERLQTDHVDLLQVHAVCDMHELDIVTGPEGPLGALERARSEGMVNWLGITGHTEAAPWVHAEALRRFDFDSVLTVYNYQLMADPKFADGFEALSALVRERDVALRVIKAIAHKPWLDAEHTYSTWYVPFDTQERISAAVSWVLANPLVTGIATAGETRLLDKMIEAEANRLPFEAAERVLAGVEDFASIF